MHYTKIKILIYFCYYCLICDYLSNDFNFPCETTNWKVKGIFIYILLIPLLYSVINILIYQWAIEIIYAKNIHELKKFIHSLFNFNHVKLDESLIELFLEFCNISKKLKKITKAILLDSLNNHIFVYSSTTECTNICNIL